MNKKGQIVEIPADSAVYKLAPHVRGHKEWLRRSAFPKSYSLFDGFLIGEHSGVEQFRLGQRRGIGAGGKAAPLYVIGIDRVENRIFTGAGEMHPGLWMRVFSFSSEFLNRETVSLLADDFSEKGLPVQVVTSQTETEAVLYIIDANAFLEFSVPTSITLLEQSFAVRHQQRTLFETNHHIH